MEADTASLRNAAPNWTLAGDKQLLGMLQHIHQSIITKCQDANTKLEAMVDALDNASLDLQNVNNKFMALSNTQFVESRVYDDDVDIKGQENPQKPEPPRAQPETELQKVKRCLQQLEMMHEPVLIMDSDSSDDEESSMVLKPKDIYAHRPLPYIIGSQAWKNKWHAGLLPEDSDSDSSLSKRDEQDEEYSDSEREVAADATDRRAQRTISSSSMESEVLSSQPASQSASQSASQPVATPAQLAAELARRLAGPPQAMPEPQTMLPPEPTTKKFYGIDKPTPATIFSNEPPPLDSSESDPYSDEDIFAELHRKSNSNGRRRKGFAANDIVEELFGEPAKDIGTIVDNEENSTAREDSPLFDDAPTNTVPVKPTNKQTHTTDSNIKKPIGGISLFGSNKGAESIGAAILKRHQRKSTSDENDSDEKPPLTQEPVKDNKKIIDDLFVKPVKKDATKKVGNVNPVKDTGTKKIDIKPAESKPKDKVDLFSENLFDDIDDIFTTNVTTTKKDTTKSIFDDDDLFSDVVEKIDKPQEKKEERKDAKSIFDSDDDLFTENDKNLTNNSVKKEDKISIPVNKSKEKQVSSIFDDDSDDNLFSDYNETKKAEPNVIQVVQDDKPTVKDKKDINIAVTIKDKPNATENISTNNNLPNTVPSNKLKSPNLFDDDDDDIDNLFGSEQNLQSVLKTPQISKEIHTKQEKEDINEIDLNVDKGNNDFEQSEQISSKQNENNLDAGLDKQEKLPIVNEDIKDDFINKNTDEINSQTIDDIEERKVITEQDDKIEEFKDDVSNIEFTEKEPLFADQLRTEPNEPDIFSDIFNDLPPAFEKPIESKKSKNVNALFDDDSDDEALFFKKNDAISDEKPDLDFGNDRFRIFHDEPPDIDVDFSQKPSKTSNIVISEDNIDELFTNKPIDEGHDKIETESSRIEEDNPQKEEIKAVDITKLLEDFNDNNTKPVNISKLLEDESSEDADTKLESKVEQIIQNIEDNKSDDYKDTNLAEDDINKKSVGKLKAMNFNINVNTLLPGASPKKVNKVNEEIDGQGVSKSYEIPNPNIAEPKMVKSVSFEGDPESEVLDNKLSKGRAKIQVKRRPSTRRARLEAVRKSGIDFTSDSTDNSSSFDEPKPKSKETDTVNRKENLEKLAKDTDTINPDKTLIDTNSNKETITKMEQKPEVKSKVVYILNDEDIFSDSHNNTKKQNDDLIKDIKGKDKSLKESTSKVGVKDRKPLFDDLSDEELFGKRPAQKKENLFDSDSEGKLFSKRLRPEKEARSLFEGSDDDDLFSRSRVPEIKPTRKQNQPTNKPTEPVFEDPLSLLGEEDS